MKGKTRQILVTLQSEPKIALVVLILANLCSYLNLSAKVLRFITEAVELGYVFDYILKADDDTWLQMDLLAQKLLDAPRELYYAGNMFVDKYRMV